MGNYLKVTPPQSNFSVALIKSYQGPTSLTLSTRYFNKVEMMPTKFTQIQTFNKRQFGFEKNRSFTCIHKCYMQAQITLQQDVDLKRKLFKVPETCAHVSDSKAVTHTLYVHYSRVRHSLHTHCCCQRHNQSGKRLLRISDKSGYSSPPFFTFKLCFNGNIFHRYYICPCPLQMCVPIGGVSLKASTLC